MIETIYYHSDNDYNKTSNFTIVSDNGNSHNDYKRITRWCEKNNIGYNAKYSKGFTDISIDTARKNEFTNGIKYFQWLGKLGLHETFDIVFDEFGYAYSDVS